MAKTNESRELKDDKEKEINFPEIETNKRRVMLDYMAEASMHSNRLKASIEEFLLAQKKAGNISDIEAYFNTSIYFRISSDLTQTILKNLNAAFKSHITIFKKQHPGKIFWVFNIIVTYGGNPNGTSAMIGLGDESYHEDFKRRINP